MVNGEESKPFSTGNMTISVLRAGLDVSGIVYLQVSAHRVLGEKRSDKVWPATYTQDAFAHPSYLPHRPPSACRQG